MTHKVIIEFTVKEPYIVDDEQIKKMQDPQAIITMFGRQFRPSGFSVSGISEHMTDPIFTVRLIEYP